MCNAYVALCFVLASPNGSCFGDVPCNVKHLSGPSIAQYRIVASTALIVVHAEN